MGSNKPRFHPPSSRPFPGVANGYACGRSQSRLSFPQEEPHTAEPAPGLTGSIQVWAKAGPSAIDSSFVVKRQERPMFFLRATRCVYVRVQPLDARELAIPGAIGRDLLIQEPFF